MLILTEEEIRCAVAMDEAIRRWRRPSRPSPECLRLGEIYHAVEAGVLREEDVAGELGDLIAAAALRALRP